MYEEKLSTHGRRARGYGRGLATSPDLFSVVLQRILLVVLDRPSESLPLVILGADQQRTNVVREIPELETVARRVQLDAVVVAQAKGVVSTAAVEAGEHAGADFLAVCKILFGELSEEICTHKNETYALLGGHGSRMVAIVAQPGSCIYKKSESNRLAL